MINNKDIEKLKETFATKEDIENLIEIVATKEDMASLKKDILSGQDKILAMVTALSQEKTVGSEQNKRQKRVLEIHHNALRKNKILSEKESLEIDKLRVF